MRQIITVATMKGGSGKSTLASCLAVHWHLCGRPSTIIDADPQRSIARLAAREKALGGVTVVEDASENAWKTARNLAATGPIIIDTPGFRSLATLACIAAADFLLVPVKASPLDIDRMLDTLNSLLEGDEAPDGREEFGVLAEVWRGVEAWSIADLRWAIAQEEVFSSQCRFLLTADN